MPSSTSCNPDYLGLKEEFRDLFDLKFPAIGSVWFNNRRKEFFTVIGMVSPCGETDKWQVLYRSNSWKPEEHRSRSIEDWYGLNRDGKPRFVEYCENHRNYRRVQTCEKRSQKFSMIKYGRTGWSINSLNAL
jgi:hypothetical protein